MRGQKVGVDGAATEAEAIKLPLTVEGARPAFGLRAVTSAPEFIFVAALATLVAGVSVTMGLPFSLSDERATKFLSTHYLVPLGAVFLWVCFVVKTMGDRRGYVLASFAGYSAVMVMHFNFKLWVPFINSTEYDPLYWYSDQALGPIVEICFAAGRFLSFVPDQFYAYSFITLFYISFTAHALDDALVFRRFVFAAMLIQGLGALSYVVAPAVGPFIYERGVADLTTQIQHDGFRMRQMMLAAGPEWLRENGPGAFGAGLAAMPSLHAGVTWLFLLFAAKYQRRLLILYVPIFAYILLMAVANRFHYVIDLPIGMALAHACFAIAARAIPPRPQPEQYVGISQPVLAEMEGERA